MGLGGISIWELAIVLVIVVLIFGTKRLKSIGTDVGGMIKGFRGAMSDEQAKPPTPDAQHRIDQAAEPDADFPERKAEQKKQTPAGAASN